MTESEVAATEASAPGPGRWRRPGWITAALVIPIVAMLFWARPSAVYATPGEHNHPASCPAVAQANKA